MSTKKTQDLILDTAIQLFNQYGTRQVSSNRIAETCGVSKGNLHYHFRNKESIIQSIYHRVSQEIETHWGDDTQNLTVKHMSDMFERQLDLIWRYRFLYRELTTLLENDPDLKKAFRDTRKRRRTIVAGFFDGLIENGVLAEPRDPQTLSSLITIGWILSDYWISYIAIDSQEIDQSSIAEAYRLLIDLFKPYLTESALQEIERQYKNSTPL